MQKVAVEHSTAASLLPLLRHVAGSSAQIAALDRLNGHHDYGVFLVRLVGGESWIVKLAGREAAHPAHFEQAARLYRRIRLETNVPVADVIAVDDGFEPFPFRYLIQTCTDGLEWAQVEPLLDAKARRAAYREMGNAIAQLHTMAFPEFGEIDKNGDATFFPALLGRIERMVADQSGAKYLSDIVRDRAPLFARVTTPALVHDDLHHHNLLFRRAGDTWRLAAVLDFDKAWAGDSTSDLARLDLWTQMMGAGFREAYQAIKPIDADYEARRPVYQLQWCLEYGATTLAHRETTRQVFAQLKLDPVYF